jgi:predicted Zn-dependent protease
MKTIISIFVSLVCIGCANTKVSPLQPEMARGDLYSDEMTLWDTSDKHEAELNKKSSDFKGKAEMAAYVDRVLRKVAPEFYEHSDFWPGVNILANDVPNAFVMPNGAVYVHTGLLSIMENEAQLAIVLWHEYSHFKYRHSLRKVRDAENNAFGTALGVAASVAVHECSGKIERIFEPIY